MLKGLAAGIVGFSWQQGAIGLASAVTLASLLVLAIAAAGFAAVLYVREYWALSRLAHAVASDGAELLLAAPLVFLMAATFATSPATALLAAVSMLCLIGLGVWALSREREKTERERSAQLVDRPTGALSRAGLEQVIALEHARVLRGAQPAGLLVCDLDHFGAFNKTHGLLAGNAVLEHVVSVMKAEVRSMDSVARWGGEEFCVLTPRVGALEEVELVAERIREAIAASPVELAGEPVSVTISIGGTLLTDWVSPEQAFARADTALRTAKLTRNQTRVLGPVRPEAGVAVGALGAAS